MKISNKDFYIRKKCVRAVIMLLFLVPFGRILPASLELVLNVC